MGELAAERAAIREALRERDIEAWLYEEDNGARPQSAQETFRQELASADLYLGVFWKNYGEYTIEEYELARELGKPILIYEKRTDVESSRDPRLQAFLDRVQDVETGHTVRWIRSADEIGRAVQEDLAHIQAEYFRKQHASPPPRPSLQPTDKEHRDLLILLEKVRQFWVTGVLEKSVYDELRVELGLEQEQDAIDHPWSQILEVPGQSAEEVPSARSIASIFDETGRTLLILGAPGSGKTITLLELARALIERAEQDPTHPIPVVFNLSSWGEHRRPLIDWLVEEFKLKYNVPARFSVRWLEQHRITLLLDGLDEVTAGDRAACVDAINAFAGEYGLPGLAVCSRRAEYEALPNRLRLGGAVCIQPLSPERIQAYLARGGERLEPLRQLIDRDPVLQSLADTPLMLNVMSLAFQDQRAGDPIETSPSTEQSWRTHLFGTYVQRMLNRKGVEDGAFTDEQVIAWLGWLSRKMQDHGKTMFLIEELQPEWLGSRLQRFLYTLFSRLLVGLVVGLPFGFVVGLIEGINTVPYFGLIIGLSAGLSLGLVDGSRWMFTRFWGRLHRRSFVWIVLVYMFFCGAGFALFGGLLDGLPAGNADRLVAWLVSGLIFGLVGGLFFGFRNRNRHREGDIRTVERLSWSTRAAFRGARMVALVGMIVGVVAVLIVRLIVTVVFVQSEGSNVDLVTVLFEGLVQELIYVVLTGSVIGSQLGAVFGGLVPTNVIEKSKPNQGILLSYRNAVKGGLLVGLMLGGLGLLVVTLIMGLAEGLIAGVLVGSMAALFAWLWYGGQDVLQHGVLRFMLNRQGHMPIAYRSFLDYAAQLILLRKVGGGYIFIHRMLQEHFAGQRS